MSEKSTQRRKDRVGEHRTTYEKNRRRILMSQDICAICGRPVNKSLKTPDPNAPEIDHIIPISMGGHPSDISNLQLVHSICNKAKSNKLPHPPERGETNGNQWTVNWLSYRAQ